MNDALLETGPNTAAHPRGVLTSVVLEQNTVAKSWKFGMPNPVDCASSLATSKRASVASTLSLKEAHDLFENEENVITEMPNKPTAGEVILYKGKDEASKNDWRSNGTISF